MSQTRPSNPQTWTGRTVYLASTLGGPVRSTVVGAQLKAGGQGGVYRDAGRPDLVLKISHTRTPEERSRTLAMLSAPPVAQVAQYDGVDIIQIAWPQQLVLDRQGEYLGFSMRFLDTRRTTSLTAWTNRRERGHWKLSRDDRLRVNLAANLASVTDYVHRAGHALVDLKPDNVQAYRDGYVCLLDCDGFRIEAGGMTFPASVSTPNWRAPEMQSGTMSPSLIGEQQDRFSLALVIYQLLDNDIHPFSGINTLQPHQSWDVPSRITGHETFLNPVGSIAAPVSSHHAFFADDTLALFRRAFLSAPDRRPTAAEWTAHLRQLALHRLQECPNDPAHWHYGKGCPWCLQHPHAIRVPSAPALPALPVFHPTPSQPAPKTLPSVPSLTSWLKPKRTTTIALFLLGTTTAVGLAYNNPWSGPASPVIKTVSAPPDRSPPSAAPPASDPATDDVEARLEELQRRREHPGLPGTTIGQSVSIPPAIIDRYEQLNRRATVVRRALALRRASQGSSDWTMSSDMAAWEQQMEDAMRAASEAIERRQEQAAIAQLNRTERALQPLERFLKL